MAWLDVPMFSKKGRIIVRQPIAKEFLVNLVGIDRSLEIHADGDCYSRMIWMAHGLGAKHNTVLLKTF